MEMQITVDMLLNKLLLVSFKFLLAILMTWGSYKFIDAITPFHIADELKKKNVAVGIFAGLVIGEIVGAIIIAVL